MKPWNIYLAIVIDHAPSRASQLVVYQITITSENNQYPLTAWLNYDMHFCTLAASDPQLWWDVPLTNLWLECISGTPAITTRWPCCYCGATTHYPEDCLFRTQPMPELPRGQHPPPTSTSIGGQHSQPTPGNISQPWYQFNDSNLTMEQPSYQWPRPTFHTFKRSVCRRSSCNFLHQCELCCAHHSTRTCPNRDRPAF